MIETFRCDDKGTLVAYLYDEIDGKGRLEVERHLRTCVACAAEARELQVVRDDLMTWVPPDADLGFAVVRQSSAHVLRPSRWAALATLPAWAQVAAAMLVIGVGAAIANVQVRSGSDGVVVTTGWMAPSSVNPVTAVTPAVSSNEEWRPALVALEQNLRREMVEANRTAGPAVVAARTQDASAETASVLRRVQAMLDASERRQREELALRLTQANRDWSVTRQTDLQTISRNFGSLQGRTIRTAADQQEMMNLLRRVSVQPVP